MHSKGGTAKSWNMHAVPHHNKTALILSIRIIIHSLSDEIKYTSRIHFRCIKDFFYIVLISSNYIYLYLYKY